jgi:hypothetical protein
VTAAVYFRQAQPTRHDTPNRVEVASIPQVQASPSATESNNTGEKATPPSDTGKVIVSVSEKTNAAQKFTTPKRAAPLSRVREGVATESRGEMPRVGSIDAAFSTARVRLPDLNSVNSAGSRVPAQGIQLGTSAGTLRVVLRDERGTLVPMRSVSFGSQEPLSRQAASSRLTSKDEEGVW